MIILKICQVIPLNIVKNILKVIKKQQEAKKIKYKNDENYREQQLKKKKERYDNDPEYRAKTIQKALDRYYKIKQTKVNESIECN